MLWMEPSRLFLLLSVGLLNKLGGVHLCLSLCTRVIPLDRGWAKELGMFGSENNKITEYFQSIEKKALSS